MATYEEFAGRGTYASADAGDANYQGMVRGWANRDVNVLPQHVIMSALSWSADRVYKQLRIPPLENTETFTAEAVDIQQEALTGYSVLTLPVPSDMIEPIYIRRASDGTVFNSRIDRRTVYDQDAQRLINSFTQIGDDYKVFGRFSAGDVVELHYYRRLPGLDATYTVNAANYNSGNGAGAVADGHYLKTSNSTDGTALFFATTQTPSVTASVFNSQGALGESLVEVGPDEGTPLYFQQRTVSASLFNSRQGLFTAVSSGGTNLYLPTNYPVTRDNAIAEPTLYTFAAFDEGNDSEGTAVWVNALSSPTTVEARHDENATIKATPTGVAITVTNYNNRGKNLDLTASDSTGSGLVAIMFTVEQLQGGSPSNLELADTAYDSTGTGRIALNFDAVASSSFTPSSTDTAYDSAASVPSGSRAVAAYFEGNEAPHWLRDENERMLMYGALIEVFNYLDEPESMARYNGLFQEEIDRLNMEQQRRFTMGGNVQVSYNGALL